jgi:hypothetical protein
MDETAVFLSLPDEVDVNGWVALAQGAEPHCRLVGLHLLGAYGHEPSQGFGQKLSHRSTRNVQTIKQILANSGNLDDLVVDLERADA